MFGVDGKIPPTEPCTPDEYEETYDGRYNNVENLLEYVNDPSRNKGNRYAKGPPKGSKNNVKQYWYRTPFEEGTCIGKDHLVSLGFPPSIHTRRDDHYIGGTSYRNKALAGYEFKTLNTTCL